MHVKPTDAAQRRLPIVSRHRKAMIETLARHFYVNEQGLLVSNGLSTELIAFPSDNYKNHQPYLSFKIRNAMAYASAFNDVEEINALKHIALHSEKVTPDNYLVLGLYLYLADECSRLGKTESFLTAMRQAGAGLPVDETNINRTVLLGKVKGALARLGMLESHGAILDDWFSSSSYNIEGDMHSGDGTRANLRGAYAILAQDVSMHNPAVLGLNLSISYALGNRSHIVGKSAREGYEMTRASIQPDGKDMLDAIIMEGDRVRETNIQREIEATVPPAPQSYQASLGMIDRKAKAILNYLPDAVLEVLCRDAYMFSYSDSPTIAPAYPVKDLPGLSHDDNEGARGGKALRQGRYHMIFLSNGRRIDPGALENNEPLKEKIAAQSILHESMHVIISHLPDAKRDALKAGVEAMYEEMKGYTRMLPYFEAPLSTIDTNSLAEVLNYDSRLYKNYLHKETVKGVEKVTSDTRWEEVACNVLGLMHTDHPYSNPQGMPNPYVDLRSFGALAAQVQDISADVARECSERNWQARVAAFPGRRPGGPP